MGGVRQRVSWWKNKKRKREQRVCEKLSEVKQWKKENHVPVLQRGEVSAIADWAETGAQSVFIGLQDFNPQYWPKPLAEGW